MGAAPSKTISGPSADGIPEMYITDAVEQLRNIPHIQPNSLSVPYSSNNRHLSLDLTCQVNAPVSCRVSIFMMGKEAEDGTVHSNNPVRSLVCQPGFLQEFPGKEHQHIMKLADIQGHARHFMRASEDNAYPIVLRVESYASRFSFYGLNQLPAADSPQMQGYMSYLNVHTIFARLQMHMGGWKVDVVKQHLWRKGNCYVLPSSDTLAKYTLHQEPRPSDPQPALVAAVPKRKPQLQVPAARPALCMLCEQRPVQVTNFPCNHACMCLTCAQRQVHMLPCCPRCNQGLQKCIPLFNQAPAA